MKHVSNTARQIIFSFMIVMAVFAMICSHGSAAEDSGSLSGTVLDDQGQPIENLIVQVWSNMCWNTFLGDATTDAAGNYLVEGLPAQNVYVIACSECTNINYIQEWWNNGNGTTDCGGAAAVAVEQDQETPDIDFALVTGPRRIYWAEVVVSQGELQAAFDILPGFNHLIESAALTGPSGFSYDFDLQNDMFEWLNECSYIQAWSRTFDNSFEYGEYTITIVFQDGYQVSESYDLQQADVTPVDMDSMSHTVNPDGSIDLSWTSSAPGQRYQARVYQNGERVYRSSIVLDMESIQVPTYQLRCLIPGVEAVWEVRTYDDSSPANAVDRSGYKPLTYASSALENRISWIEATKIQSDPDQLSLYFDTRPGSREQTTSAVVTGPDGFTPYTFDLVSDWYDRSTESRTSRGWWYVRPATVEPIMDGEYTMAVTFDDGYVETWSYTLSADDLTPVDADSMGYDIFENGAIQFHWSLPQGVSGQQYQVRIRSKDGSREFVRSSPQTDITYQYFSVWDLRALPHGDQFTWFVRAYSGDDGDTDVETWSNQLLTYNPFDITARGGSTFVLTSTSPDLAVTAGSDVIVYGTAVPSEVTLAAGANAKLVNFAGDNLIMIQSQSDLFSISRSGTTVTFEGTDGTLLEIPATTSEQTIVFDQDDAVMVLQIQGNQVMLDGEVI